MNNAYFKELCSVFTTVRTKREAAMLLKDILTPSELADITRRWQLIKKLAKGLPHREISRSLKISIAKVTRGSRAWKKSHGGFRLFLARNK